MRERLLAYLLGELEGAERAEVEAELERSPEFRAEAALWRRVLESLRPEPPPISRRYVRRRAELVERAGRERLLRRPWVAAAAAAVLLGLGYAFLLRPAPRPRKHPPAPERRADLPAPPASLVEEGIDESVPPAGEPTPPERLRVESVPVEPPPPGLPRERFGRQVLVARTDPVWRQRLLRRYGGGARTEAAVLRGLRHLLRYQRADGAFAVGGDPVGTTGLVVQAFLGRGLERPFRGPARRGLRFLLGVQRPDGFLGRDADAPGAVLSHALAAQAVLDAAAFLNLPEVPEGAVVRALRWLTPARVRGGAAGAQVVFLFTLAHRAGYPLPAGSEAALERWCRRARPEDLFAQVSRPFLGGRLVPPFLRDAPREPTGEETLLCWLYGSQALLRLGDEAAWRAWNRRLVARVLTAQAEDGRFGWPGDPARTTALGVLLLQVYYRYRGL